MRKVLDCQGHDVRKNTISEGQFDMVHICFPYTEHFVSEVLQYKQKFGAKYIVIHSTVPLTTTLKVGGNHAPVRGAHPNLEKGIKFFKMFVGGPDAWPIAAELKKYGIPAHPVRSARDTEAMKLWDTAQYGAMILLNKEIYAYCKKHGLDFDVVYTLANQTYNDGYRRMFRPEVVRPYLKYVEGPIGGHCVAPNAEMLQSMTAENIISYNKAYDNQRQRDNRGDDSRVPDESKESGSAGEISQSAGTGANKR